MLPKSLVLKLVLLVQVMKERNLIGAQLIRRNDEISLLYDKQKIVFLMLHKGELQYNYRLEDIRILKLEIHRLRCKNQVLERSSQDANDIRSVKRTLTAYCAIPPGGPLRIPLSLSVFLSVCYVTLPTLEQNTQISQKLN